MCRGFKERGERERHLSGEVGRQSCVAEVGADGADRAGVRQQVQGDRGRGREEGGRKGGRKKKKKYK